VDIPAIHRPIARYFRSRRFHRFCESFHIQTGTRVLDVGGYAYYWDYLPARPRIVIVNLDLPAAPDPRFDWVSADARALPFRDRAFDVAFSNSVLEHIPGDESRAAYAGEIQRVAHGYYVQTPYRWFPVEPHLMTPLIHFLPRAWQRPLLRRCTIWGLLHQPTPEGCDEFLRDIQLLDVAALRRLFPEATVWKERFLGLLKSISAVRLAPEPRKPAPN
jgi:hypothetical protein